METECSWCGRPYRLPFYRRGQPLHFACLEYYLSSSAIRRWMANAIVSMTDSMHREDWKAHEWYQLDSAVEWPSPLDNQPTNVIEF